MSTIQNVIIGVVIMLAIAFLFIPKLISAIWICISILSINMGVIGGLALWGVHLGYFTCDYFYPIIYFSPCRHCVDDNDSYGHRTVGGLCGARDIQFPRRPSPAKNEQSSGGRRCSNSSEWSIHYSWRRYTHTCQLVHGHLSPPLFVKECKIW